MQKFIKDRKVYNTKTSTLIHEDWNRKGRDDFHCIERDLYRRPDGEYWFRVYGGAATIYAESRRGYQTSWEGAVPVSEEEAYEYLEDRQEVALLEEHFPHFLEKEGEEEIAQAKDGLEAVHFALEIINTDLWAAIQKMQMDKEEAESLVRKYAGCPPHLFQAGYENLVFLSRVPEEVSIPLLKMIQK